MPNCLAICSTNSSVPLAPPGVHHMSMTNLEFHGIEILFSDHVDVWGHSLGNRYPVSGPTMVRMSA